MRLNMTDTHMPPHDAQLAGDARTFARQRNDRLPARLWPNLDIRPRDPAAPPGPQHLQHRFLRRESAGQVLNAALGIAIGVRLFDGRVNSIQEVIPVMLDQPADALRLDDIDA